MSVLGGVDLGSDIHIENEYSISRVDSIMERSRGDIPIIWEQSAGPQPFDLIGLSNRGVLTRAKMEQLLSLASSTNSIFSFTYNGTTKNVCFRHWEGDVIEAEPLGPREEMTDNDFYRSVRIKLMEV